MRGSLPFLYANVCVFIEFCMVFCAVEVINGGQARQCTIEFSASLHLHMIGPG